MKHIFIGLLALLCVSILPAPTRAADDTIDTMLANGMRVVIVHNSLAPVVTTYLTYGVGGVDDTMPGIAHATEHMLFRGTAETSSDELANIATRIGADYNAQTGNTATSYYFTMPAMYLDVVLHVEADRMLHATMSESDWKNERGAIEQEVKAHESNPLYPVFAKSRTLLLGDSPWSKDSVGTVPSFEKMTAADIAAFYHKWYHPNNATLVIVGDVAPGAALASVKAHFDALRSASLPAHPTFAVHDAENSAIDQKVDFPLPVAASAFVIPGRSDPDYDASEVLFGTLNASGGALADLVLDGKVLFALGVPASFPNSGVGSLLAIARPGSPPADALTAIQIAMNGYAQSGIPDALIELTKKRIYAQQSYGGATIPGEAALWTDAITTRNSTPDKLFAEMASVSDADVNRVFRTYVTGSKRVTMLLQANPGASLTTTAEKSAGENVAVKASEDSTLPAWTKPYFSAPLRVPDSQQTSDIFKLKNGMRIAVRRETSAPVVVIAGGIRGNTDMNEPKDKDGVSSFTSSLMQLGTTTHDFKAYQAQVDAIAANVTLGSHMTATVRKENFDRAVELLAEGELHPGFAPDRFALVSKNAEQTIKATENLPETKANLARLYALYPPNDPHRRHPTATSIASITLADVKKWYAFAYRPQLTTIVVVGDIDPETVRATFQKYFGGWHVQGPPVMLDYPRIKNTGKPKSTTVTSSTAKQADVTLEQSFAMRSYDRDTVALRLANTILSGEGTGSLLFHDVRKQKGYVYSIDSSLRSSRDGSTFSVEYESDTKNVAAAQAAAIATIERLRKYPPSDNELTLAKAMVLSDYVVPLASYDGVAGDLLRVALDGGDTHKDYLSQVLATTPQQVQQAMQRWIDTTKFTRVVVAPGD